MTDFTIKDSTGAGDFTVVAPPPELEAHLHGQAETLRVSAYQQEIIKLDGSSMYLRIDTGPDLESALLCVDDGEADTNDIATFYNIGMAKAFAAFWAKRLSTIEPAATSECATEGCGQIGSEHFEAGGIGSNYCPKCAGKVRALTAASAIGGVEPVIDFRALAQGFADALGHAEWPSPRGAEELLQDIIDTWHPKLRAALAASAPNREVK